MYIVHIAARKTISLQYAEARRGINIQQINNLNENIPDDT